MNGIRIALLLSALALAARPALAQQMYRWVDEKGVTHYDEKPGGKSAKPVELVDPTGGAKPAEKVPSTTRTYTRSDGSTVTVTEQSNETKQQRDEREFQQRHAQRVKDMNADARSRSSQLAAERSRKRSSCDHAQRKLASLSISKYPQERRHYQEIASRDC